MHKLIKPTLPYRGNNDIGYRIEQSQIALTTDAKNLEKKRALQKKPHEHRPSDHKFKVGDLVLLYKHNKDKLKLQWEPGYRIVALPTKWIARIKNKETGEPKRVSVKDPAEDWELKAEDMGRGAKFVNDPSNLPDIDWIPENDISNSPDKDQEKPDDIPNKSNDCDRVKKHGLRRNIKPKCLTYNFSLKYLCSLILYIILPWGATTALTESVILYPVGQIQTSKSSWIVSSAVDFGPYTTAVRNLKIYSRNILASIDHFQRTINFDKTHEHLIRLTFYGVNSSITAINEVHDKLLKNI